MLQLSESVLNVLLPSLLGGNIFFIKKLIDKIEAADIAAKEAKGAAQGLNGLMRELKQDIKDLRRIEIDVAILKNSIPNRVKKQSQSNINDGRDNHDGNE